MQFAPSGGHPAPLSLSTFHSAFKSYIEGKISTSPLLLFRRLLRYRVTPNDSTFSLLIKAFVLSSSSSSFAPASSSENAKAEANQLQTHFVKWGFDQFLYVSTAFLNLYSKLGHVKAARRLFDDIPEKDVVLWNALISGYSRSGYSHDAFELFVEMRRRGFKPRQRTVVSLIPACGSQQLFVQGKSIHALGIKAGLDLDSHVKNALASMYAKCSDVEGVELFFGEMMEKSVVSWNTRIGAFGQNGFFVEAMLVFKQMLEESVNANSVTMVTILSANANPGSIHCYATKTGLVENVSVVTSLVCSYVRCGNIQIAELIYMSLLQKDLVSLTAIISSYAEKGDIKSVVKLYSRMQHLDMKLDAVAMIGIIQGITYPDHFGIGLTFHGYGLKSGLIIDCLVANGFISMYSKFDDIAAVFSLFHEMHEKTLSSWNTVISSCAQAGRSIDAMVLFSKMKLSGYGPDSITIASLLSACCQNGNLHFGERLHCYNLRNNLDLEGFVGTALVDMYVKCGRLDFAERVFKSMKEPCLASWNSMISGYGLFGFDNHALLCYTKMIEKGIKPNKITFSGILAACTHGGLVREGKTYFKIMMEEFGIAPELQHCASMVGLLGRAGLFEEAIVFIKNMEINPDSAVWGALLSACCIHQEVKLGESVAKKLLFSNCRNGGFFVLMSNLYAASRRWNDVARVRKMMREMGEDGCSGVSLMEWTSLEDTDRDLYW
ncbi:pentatricopeptide repeat-containing protein At2g04860 [Momordica charantia]|uniref:Pentatricopeptide repeat-containing protein At2g04860 n=1 Tax=Momordica charantia TaxID=3673 RepID=A0A6J1BXV1_MOMCH|nr:pentatricopeptide repeat-containing protein At2g04860 [Momordica charantia]